MTSLLPSTLDRATRAPPSVPTPTASPPHGTSASSMASAHPPPSPLLLPPSPLPPSPSPSPLSLAPNMSHLSVFCAPKAGMTKVDVSHVNQVVFEMSKDSAHFRHQQSVAAKTSTRISAMQRRIADLKASPPTHLSHLTARAHSVLSSLEGERDLTRVWIHCDLDSFYASVELLTRPELRDKPVAVGGLSMICTSNYVARQSGVRAAMPGFIALKLCPDLIFLPTDFPKYTQIAGVFRAVFADYDPQYESGSLDEAYLDITAHLQRIRLQRPVDSPWDLALEAQAVSTELRRRVFESTQLTCSCGIACNRMLAKIATDMQKPNGQFWLEPTLPAILTFIANLPVRKVPGIGKVQERILHELGVQMVGELRDDRFAPLIVELFSEGTARWLFAVSLGLGRSEHEDEEERKRKSVSCERTFRDINRWVELEEKVEEIARHLADDVQRVGVKGHTLTLKLKTATFEVKQRSHTGQRWLQSYTDIHRIAVGLLKDELNLLLAGKKVKKSASAVHEGKEGGGEGGVRGVGLARSPFDGLLRLRLMGLRLSSIAFVGEEEGDESKALGILKFTKPVEGVGDTEGDVSEIIDSGAVKRRKAGDVDISRYFGVGSSAGEEGQEGEVGKELGGRRGGRGSRRSIVDFFHQAAMSTSTDTGDDDIELLLNPHDGGEEEDSLRLQEQPQGDGNITQPPSPPSTSSLSPSLASLASAAPSSVSPVIEATCPMCGEQLGVGLSNLAINAHVDRCLQGKSGKEEVDGQEGEMGKGQTSSIRKGKGKDKRKAGGGPGDARGSLMGFLQRRP